MRSFIRFIRRNWLLLPFIVVAVAAVGIAAYLAGTIGLRRDALQIVPTGVVVTNPPPLPGTPPAPYQQVDPAVIAYLDQGQPSYGIIPLDVVGAGVQPVGAYLPRTGNTRFELGEPTPLPTPLPYPTSPPLPIPAPPPGQPLPTIPPFAPDGTPRTLPYAGADCAPAGLPVSGSIFSQRFHAYHSGIDLALPLGSPVIATHSGIVSFADWNTFGYGYLVIIQNGTFITYYAHLTSFNVITGQAVGKDSIIAWSGSTGNSSGPHVHYETRINDIPVDPMTFEDRGYGTC